MKTLYILRKALVICLICTAFSSCFDDDLLLNPNASDRATSTVVLNHLTAAMVSKDEMAFGGAHRTNQYYVSNYSYYWGSNYYNWTNTTERYDLLKYAIKLEEEAYRQYGENENVYMALAKFYRAYSGVWLSQRVGDIPFAEAGNPDNLTPKFDTQKDVYKEVLVLLDDANKIMDNLITKQSTNSVSANSILDKNGDVFGMSNLQWQKVINTFRLRILVSLSKRADDTPDLKIKEQFAEIVNNPTAYPLMQSNSDNMVYRYNSAYNPYPIFSSKSYTYGANIGKSILDITTSDKDPRTFVFATPAPAQYKVAGKSVSDFSSYVGASTNSTQAELYSGTDTKGTTDEDKGAYSYINYKRYFSSQDGSTAEPYIVIGYSEMCFNIAEAIAKGWLSGDAKSWYNKGITASLSFYGLTHGTTLTIGDRLGGTIGSVVINTEDFLNNSNVAYKGNNENGIQQILTQKYVTLFCNSGFEAYYNWLRTGYPTLQEGGNGIGTSNKKLSRRWMYPVDEISYNNEHYKASIQQQYGGTDDVTYNIWLFK
ncbi:SusD/RagB family nutrient-binding outer membrane lipoprotein [Dysgonomonas sp. BGC7]|uniref:SusD/RagB family nutrient-binding outer membrane lipoprotein n=1 Tax=Dysgonomonas sp. BGC7 TaxID=1658008 RepID=UPI000681125A|nr:SusD/RagB family nutrient-binding outer membrane lipoprotein [Dysgonomonas sp. BGC7]MBD8389357.1 SusD/RagB family nutrient-binding outer membrane lipoprotein [Dysgonomonas sp. BGC7]